ncbi:unnamed protein product [Rhizoctonia solani]|uniref:Uncharacterized protein n=1 Tax=Rhizoctonia solani TaxID=456999 RepID=A0A8H3BGC4_9AGAM|nr:unnamed protein product [Rhizoctonia solani]
MPLLPTLKDQTGHPYTNGHLWLCLTILLSVLTLPPIVVFNIITQGSELVPWLQPTFNPDNTNLEQWWGTRYLPKRLRPALPQCQPQEVGRGDIFQLSASMFVYTVMGTWNTSHSPIEDQGQNKVGYRGESFANCSVANALYDYSLSERTHSVAVGVRCPGYDDYSVALSVQTTMTFASETTKSFIGQYYGPGLDLLDLTKTTNYRQTALAVLDVISTDALSILSRQHLPVAPLRMRVYFDDITDTEALLPDQTTTSSITYVNGSQTNNMPAEGFIYSSP